MLFLPSRLMTALFAAACLAAPAAQAATHELQLRLDASQLKPGLLSGGDATSGVELRVGDTLVLDISFLPGQSLLVSQPLSFAFMAASSDLSASIDFGLANSLALRGLQGKVLAQGSGTQTVNGNALQSLFFGPQLGLPMGGSLSLSGLSFTTTVQSYGDGAASHVFGRPQLAIVAGSLSSSVSPVPEPAPRGLTFLGLAALGLWFARQRMVRYTG